MNVTIRKARAADRRFYNWQPYQDPAFPYDGPFTPWVVTVDGLAYLFAETHGDAPALVWQNGSAAVPDLLRMFRRYIACIGTLHSDKHDRAEAKAEASLRETMQRMRERA